MSSIREQEAKVSVWTAEKKIATRNVILKWTENNDGDFNWHICNYI